MIEPKCGSLEKQILMLPMNREKKIDVTLRFVIRYNVVAL